MRANLKINNWKEGECINFLILGTFTLVNGKIVNFMVEGFIVLKTVKGKYYFNETRYEGDFENGLK